MNYTIKNADIEIYNDSESFSFPKYTSQLINWANQNAQGTRPKVVGQMSELFPEFLESDEEKTIEGWRKWYTERYPDAFQNATDKIWEQVVNLKNAIPLIDKEMVEHWVEDLVVYKTFNGLYVQKAILASLAKKKWTTYRLATPEEESKGIDGYVGNTPYQVKADSQLQGLQYLHLFQLQGYFDLKQLLPMLWFLNLQKDLKRYLLQQNTY